MVQLYRYFAVCFAVLIWALNINFIVIPNVDTAVPYPEGYREWVHIQSALIGPKSPAYKRFGGFHHIYANTKAQEGYKSGKFPDGAIIVADFLETVKKDIVLYVKNKKLQKPILLGHSMGGFIAFWSAASSPSYFRGRISVDGLPSVAALRMPNASPDSINAIAMSTKTRMNAVKTPEQSITSQKQSLRCLCLAPKKLKNC